MIRSSVDSLNNIPYHSHKSLKCSNPDLTYYQSYSRSFIVYKDNTVTTLSLSIPVFAVKTVIIIMHFYLLLFLFHMNRWVFHALRATLSTAESHLFHRLEPPNPLIRAIYTLPVVRCICKILNSTNIANWRCFLHMTEKYHTSKFVWYFILLT